MKGLHVLRSSGTPTRQPGLRRVVGPARLASSRLCGDSVRKSVALVELERGGGCGGGNTMHFVPAQNVHSDEVLPLPSVLHAATLWRTKLCKVIPWW
jgi:hypothetical protein